MSFEIIALIVIIVIKIIWEKTKGNSDTTENNWENTLVERASPYLSLDKNNAVLTIHKCCREVGNAVRIQRHFTTTGSTSPSTYHLNMLTGTIKEREGQYSNSYKDTAKAKLVFDNFLVEIIQLNPEDSKRAKAQGLPIDDKGRLNVMKEMSPDEFETYKMLLNASMELGSRHGILTNNYDELRYLSFTEIQRIWKFISTPS